MFSLSDCKLRWVHQLERQWYFRLQSSILAIKQDNFLRPLQVKSEENGTFPWLLSQNNVAQSDGEEKN